MAKGGNGNKGFNHGHVTSFEAQIANGNLNGLKNGALVEHYTKAIADGYVPSHDIIRSILSLDLGASDALSALLEQMQESLAPVITSDGEEDDGDLSLASFTIDENTSAVTTVTATDPQGDAITYALSGADADLFAIDAAGNLSFVSAPDFEAPQDAGGDNVYDVTVTVSDGVLSDSQGISVTVADVNEVAAPNVIDMLAVDGDQTFQATDGVDYFVYNMDATSADADFRERDTLTVLGFDPDEDKLIFINADARANSDQVQNGREFKTSRKYYDIFYDSDGSSSTEAISHRVKGGRIQVSDTNLSGAERSSDEIILKNGAGIPIKLDALAYPSDSTDPADVESSILIYDFLTPIDLLA